MSKLSRRSFLKLSGAALSAALFPKLVSWADAFSASPAAQLPNFVIILFDAMSARNLSLYGYKRPTSPNLERFAERATVYHAHYASGNYTIPGVASLLTGSYPWTNRAVNHSGVVKQSLAGDNIFRAIGSAYHRSAFSQSIWAYFILTQFAPDIDLLMPPGTFGEVDYLLSHNFPKDEHMALRALDDFVFKMEYAPASMILGPVQRALYFRDSARLSSKGYPRGLPHNVNYPLQFRLEKVMEGAANLLTELPSPFLTYIHLFPPHAPYRASDKFDSQFIDGWVPPRKPVHRLTDGFPYSKLDSARRSYDEYIASLDWEFGKVLNQMEAAGIFDTSYVIVTSDHGEMFERGEKAHSTPLLYDPVIHVPLLVSAPGQASRRDVHHPTNAVDILPTLMHLIGQPAPSWCEGVLLPGLGGVEDTQRSSFVVEAKRSPAFRPFGMATIALRKANYKLIYYTGYEAEDSFELYDMADDPEEMQDLYPALPAIARQMREELLEAFWAANEPYKK